jgi:hypothetical protein
LQEEPKKSEKKEESKKSEKKEESKKSEKKEEPKKSEKKEEPQKSEKKVPRNPWQLVPCFFSRPHQAEEPKKKAEDPQKVGTSFLSPDDVDLSHEQLQARDKNAESQDHAATVKAENKGKGKVGTEQAISISAESQCFL